MAQQQSNFAFLSAHAPQLVTLGALAERYFRTDPNTALIKLRQFGEVLAQCVAAKIGGYRELSENQVDLLRRLEDRGSIPSESSRLFHQLRKIGNRATHEGFADHSAALSTIKIAWQLGVWFHRSYGGDQSFQSPAFIPPPDPRIASLALKEELQRLRTERAATLSQAEQAKLAQAQADEARLSAEDRARKEAEEKAEIKRLLEEVQAREANLLKELEAAQAQALQHPEIVTADITLASTAAAAIDLDEAATRTIIDSQLRDRGWEVDSEALTYASGARPAKGRNMAIAEWPTQTGPADYALFIGTTCVAVIEAKRQRKNVSAALTQSERYSKGMTQIESVGGPWGDFRVPLLFATNGRPYLRQLEIQSGIWFRDARYPTNLSRPLVDWLTPDGIKALLAIDAQAADATLKTTPLNFGFDLRPYQKRAIEEVEAALANGRRTMLVAMATGTGKTKLAIAMLSRLLEAKRFRRVCFVVDRSILGGQTEGEFRTTKIMGVRTFADSFGIMGLEDVTPDDATKVHICTIQGLVKRVLFADDTANVPPIDQYDLMVVDECHRGYLLDREMSDTELQFSDQSDYISKYRRVLEHFDAVKIGLTATPALHTVNIFGQPVFTYSYREAVADRYLIDHEPPIRIETELSANGITFANGQTLDLLNTKTGEITQGIAPDELEYDVEAFNRSVITEPFNKAVATALARYIDPSLPDKTLIFAVNDAHADIVVQQVKAALVEAYGSIDDADVRKITGSVDKPRQQTLAFRNDPSPKIAVTVDLLTTGVDVPKITNLVFLRRVNSRILYEQMLGRATRLCPEIDKETFRIFDAVDLYPTLENMTDMRPVGVEPKFTFTKLVDQFTASTDDRHRETLRTQLETRLRRRVSRLTDQGREEYQSHVGEAPEATIQRLAAMPLSELGRWLADRPKWGPILDWNPERPGAMLPISTHADQIRSITHGYGRDGTLTRPDDYLDSFAAWVRDNVNKVAAIKLVVTRPRDLTRADLKQIRLLLDGEGFAETALHRAWEQAKSEDIAASIIGHIRQAALGDPLRPYADRVRDAVAQILKAQAWTPVQQKWLRRIADDIAAEVVVDRDFLNGGQYKVDAGGFERLNKVFDGRLEALLGEISDGTWKVAG